MIDYNALLNRLAKNLKSLKKWLNKNQIEAFRLYDRDIPQFPFAIDIYGQHAHIQEYETAWKMTESDYLTWLQTVVDIVCQVTGFDKSQIHLKKRQRQRGLAQYEKNPISGEFFTISETGRQFWINLDQYLDSGLFLDHRPMRQFVGSHAKGKRFLNLFAYTGSFSVYAATSGASYSETVDLSNTYLQWAQKNFKLNQLNLTQHQIIRADIFQYLTQAIKSQKQFDLVVMDPPSFSNSKKMQATLDIQRDHKLLIELVMQLVATDGLLIFSNNFSHFKLDPELTQQFKLTDKTKPSIPQDFRNKKIHQCWFIEAQSNS